jgi:NADPH:quinone reductase-like Zn-dependent oxidoreductase
VLAPAEFVTALPDSLSDEAGALVMVNPVTLLELVRATEAAWGDSPRPYLQTAAGSSVAALVSASAVRHGYPLVNLVRSAAGAEALTQRFPSIPAFSSSDPNWKSQVRKALGGAASVVLDPIGGEIASDLMDLMEDGGTLISYGSLAGPVLPVKAMPLIQRQLRIQGVSVGTWIGRPADQRQADVKFALELSGEHPELFEVAGRYELSEFEAAVEHVQRPGKVGTVLLTSQAQSGPEGVDR